MITIEVIETVNYYIALSGVFAGIATLLLAIDLKRTQYVAVHIQKWGYTVALITTLCASVLTLIYSEIFGLVPCGLCWLERMALYPQVLLILVALRIKDAKMPVYGISLSIFGFVVSLYHHYVQMGGSEFIKCPASGGDCAKRFLFEFGFMTFPLLATILFAFLIVLYLYMLKLSRLN